MKRASGFYWCRVDNEWFVAEYSEYCRAWEVTGDDCYFTDAQFDQIDERRIVRQPEVSE